jgi:GNAT superfamily N-acetyltransferase
MKMIEIRKATYDDIEAIVRVNTKVWQSAYFGIINQKTLDTLTDTINQRITRFQKEYKEVLAGKRNLFQAVALYKNEVVGFIKYGDYRDDGTYTFEHTGEVYAIYVDKTFQKQQIGTKLIHFAVTHMMALKGYNRLIIWTLKQNPSRSFYERIGGSVKYHKDITINDQVLEEVGYCFESLEVLAKTCEEHGSRL